ncbi:hypothetical protein [Rickettsia endosymbiont of Nabis limbatus]|uniref:hypothetical protein n=1 Tax=Rickettsia endosymbiont of Nabis limbatus TaxID=3066268 RepID=UPI003AF34C4A
MGKKESKKNKLNDFHKAQLENHKEIFASVEPIITQDGKDQGEQNNIKAKKESKIMRALSKLFRVLHKSNKKVVADERSKLDRNNNLEAYDAIEEKIQQMNSKEVLQFLNTDDLSNKKIVGASEVTTKGKVAVENKSAVSWVSTITQSKSNQDRGR